MYDKVFYIQYKIVLTDRLVDKILGRLVDTIVKVFQEVSLTSPLNGLILIIHVIC